jgi:hypothetical protein
VLNIRVWPSGSELATILAPTDPPAPARFSTMNGCPSAAVSRSAMMRAGDVDAAGCERHDDPHWLDRVALRRGRRGQAQAAATTTPDRIHGFKIIALPLIRRLLRPSALEITV